MDDLNPITRTERLLDGEDLTPTNREEMFIRRIYDKTQEIPEPVNRKEYFLKKAGEAGGDITVESLSVTSNGIYSEEGKAYSPVTVAVAPPEDSYQLKSITTPTSLATFEASAMPMPSFKVSVEAKQDLHGYDKPWVGGAGKNKLPNPTAETKTVGNLTVSIDSLGIITVSGSTSETTTILFDLPSNFVIPVSVGTGGSGCLYLFNPSINNSIVLMLYNNDTAVDTWVCSEVNRKSSSYASMGGKTINKIGIRVQDATTISGSFKLSPMITNDGTTDATFAPYSNICPISGWDNAVVSDVGKNKSPLVSSTTSSSGGLESNSNKIYEFIKQGKTYTLSFDMIVAQKSETAQGNTLGVWLNDTSPSVARFPVSSTGRQTATFTASSDGFLNFWSGTNSYDANTKVIDNIQLEEGSTASTYEPYINQTTTIALGQTVYGGEEDVVNGTSGNKNTYGFKQGFTRGALDSSGKLYKLSPILDDVAMWTDTSRASEKIMSNMFEVMSLRDARTATTPSLSQHETSFYVGGYVGDEATLDALLSDLQVKYELAAPTTFTTQPTPIKSLDGINNLSVDCGEIIEGEYFKALGGE